ncbi:MAG TPA: tetratricopeptide repeat protein [Terriglobales bacterium]
MRAETRRQLKQDKFSRTTIQVAEQTVHWSAEHKGKIVVAAIAAVILISAVLGGWYYLEQQDEKASVDLSQAVQTLNTPIRPAGMPAQPNDPSFASLTERATEAHKQFQALVDKYPHTRAADFSHYFLGVTSATLGDYVAAERELKAVAGYHNADLSSLAKMALGSLYRNTNRSQDAISLYKQLMQSPTSTVGKTATEVQLAETYQDAGNTGEAKKQYEQIQKENPQGDVGQFAASKLQEMK